MARWSSRLFRFARDVDTVEAGASGNPKRIARRARNIAIGRLLRGSVSGGSCGAAMTSVAVTT